MFLWYVKRDVVNSPQDSHRTLSMGSSGISGEGRSRHEEGPAIAKVGGHRDICRARELMATESTESTDPNPTPRKTFFPLHPPTFSGKGGEHNFRGGAAGVRAFRGFRGSSGVGWKGRESSLQSLAPKIPGRTFRWPFRPDHQHVRSAAQADSLPALLILSDAQQPCESGGAGRPGGDRGDLFAE